MTPDLLLVWQLVAVTPDTLGVERPARYATHEECEIGRVQWEMQYMHITWCERQEE